MPFDNHSLHHRSQQGAALLLAIFIIGLAATAYVVHAATQAATRQARAEQADYLLSAAKDSLLGFVLANATSGMPYPDVLSEVPPNYDGLTEGGCLDSAKANGLPLIQTGITMRCLGRLPWKTIGLPVDVAPQHDPLGAMPWYAVSANLIDLTCLKALNSGVLERQYNGIRDCSGRDLPYPWLVVRDSHGNVISDRVAFIVIVPGSPLGNQKREASVLPGSEAYLDKLTVLNGCAQPCIPGTYSNADWDNDFVVGDALNLPQVNDRVLFVTIEDVVRQLERRAAGEARKALQQYYREHGRYPDAAQLGATKNYSCQAGLAVGFLPIDTPTVCRYQHNSQDNTWEMQCSFRDVDLIRFTRDSGKFSSSSNDCKTNGNATCSCNGNGRCGTQFSCNSKGFCTAKVAGVFSLEGSRFTERTGVCELTRAATLSAGCHNTDAIISCKTQQSEAVGTAAYSTTGMVCVDPPLNVSDWFRENNWQDYIYYDKSAGLTIGALAADAVLISVGKAIASPPFAPSKLSPQSRPSCDAQAANDYLDSQENVNGDTKYDAVNSPRSVQYNDQMFVITRPLP
ncbi:hypothetical protein ACIKP9_09495 [Methylobacillus methanolivorans]|uniref:Type 4 fimbrial biogenesis protein PilX N-terminal domain-containing protein n=1 Tax=Methylobacillus methanolivorans TaxID=1848927 RepID=A0ABW8GM61_9PROT